MVSRRSLATETPSQLPPLLIKTSSHTIQHEDCSGCCTYSSMPRGNEETQPHSAICSPPKTSPVDHRPYSNTSFAWHQPKETDEHESIYRPKTQKLALKTRRVLHKTKHLTLGKYTTYSPTYVQPLRKLQPRYTTRCPSWEHGSPITTSYARTAQTPRPFTKGPRSLGSSLRFKPRTTPPTRSKKSVAAGVITDRKRRDSPPPV